MANEPTINLALVGEMPENPVRGTIYMSPDTSGNFVKVGVDGSVRTIFDGSIYALRRDLPWTFGEGEGSAVLKASGSTARGRFAVAEGTGDASGNFSHAEGEEGRAYGDYSHAEGETTYARGVSSHAEGFCANAYGDYSHAEGETTVASGVSSHAEGYYTDASGNFSHAEGSETHAYGEYSHAEGHGSTESLSFTISGNANATTYTTNVAHELKVGYILEYNGIIAKVTTINNSTKFTVDHTLSDAQLTNASGIKRISGISYGDYSHAEGNDSTASSIYSHAEGSGTASGIGSHAEGAGTITSGSYSHAEGRQTIASSMLSHAEGNQTTASGTGSHAEGVNTTASAQYSHAEGSNTIASGQYSHAEGYLTKASGQYSHAEGRQTKASGDYSHAEGYNTTASYSFSHAEGYNTTASGQYSHAEGRNTRASGDYSHAEGYNTTTNNTCEHAQGFLNISHTDTIFSIGNGYYDDNNDQGICSNALEIMRNGNAYLYGVASFNGQTINAKKTLQYFLKVDSISGLEYDYIFGILLPTVNNLLSSHLIIDRIREDILPDIEDLYGSLSDYIDSIVTSTDNGDLYPGGIIATGPGPSNRWEWTGDMMSIDGDDYYVWYCIFENGADEPLYGLMPVDMTMETCIGNSMHSDILNRWSPFEYITRSDTIQNYGDLSVRYTLIYVKEYEYDTRIISDFNLLNATLYLDTFDDNTWSNAISIYSNAGVVNIGEYIDYYCDNNLNDGDSTECTYQNDITFDGETYHMWYCENGGGGYEFYGLMPLSVTAEEVANNSKYVNPFNLYCPFTYELDIDEEVYSDDPSHLKTRRCLVTVVPGE